MRLEVKDLPRAFRAAPTFLLMNSGERDGKCGHWGEVDRFGYCTDEDCRRDRLIKALHAGSAKKLPNGVLVWDVK
jgi:hypothetical protein